MYKEIFNNNGTSTGREVNEHCEFRYIDTHIPIKLNIRYDGRPTICMNLNGKNSTYMAYNVMMRAWNPLNSYIGMEVNHIDGNPTNNEIYNLEWATHDRNMKHASELKLMKHGEEHHNSKYSNDLIHEICQLKCSGISRKDIIDRLNINGQLIDDICAGRSHKDISSQYLDKGFEYNIFDRKEKENLVHQVCQLLEKGYSSSYIFNLLPVSNICFINDIKAKRTFKNISTLYNF